MKQIYISISFVIVLSLLVGQQPVAAQIQQTSKGQHKKEQRRYLKEARNTEAAYKDTHLNPDTYTHRKGEAARKRVKKRDERRQYKFDDTGQPVKKTRVARKKATSTQSSR
ncbi:MAG TPA: hypothetical protein VIG72_12490 [Pontibacter sp.]